MWLGDLIGDVISGTIDLVCEGADFVTENPIKATAVVGCTVLTGGAAFAFAPAIAATAGSAGILGAASTGIAISSLSGAALTNASLAAVGGGTLATGGGGIVAGVATVTKAGAVAGTVVSSSVAKSIS